MVKYRVDGDDLFWELIGALGAETGGELFYGAKTVVLPKHNNSNVSKLKLSKWYIEIDDTIQVYLAEIKLESDKKHYGVLAKCDNDIIYFNVIDEVFYSRHLLRGKSEKMRIENFLNFFTFFLMEKGVGFEDYRGLSSTDLELCFDTSTLPILQEKFYIYTDDDDLSMINIQNTVEQVRDFKGRPFRICERPMMVMREVEDYLFMITDGQKDYFAYVVTDHERIKKFLDDESHSLEEVNEALKSNKKCIVRWIVSETDKDMIWIIDAKPIKDTKISEYELEDKMQQQNIEKLSTFVKEYKRESFYDHLEKITNDIAENEYQRGFIAVKGSKESAIKGWRDKKITQLKLYTDITDQMLNKMRHYEEKGSLYKKRVRVFLAYALTYGFSYNDTMICIELLNGGLDLSSINENLLLKLIECNICSEYEDRLERIDKVLYKVNPVLSLRNLLNMDNVFIEESNKAFSK